MRLATFVAQGTERFGIVVTHPATGEVWIFDPEQVQERLQAYASLATSPYKVSLPRFLAERPWPRELADFLSLGDKGMSAARHLRDFLLRFLEQADQALLAGAGYPLRQVRLRAPIPRPRLYFGLVKNAPALVRNDPSRLILNLYPQGHQRPQGTVASPGEPVLISPEIQGLVWNPELGVIIGRGGQDIDVKHAMEHVAGYTVVLDMTHGSYYPSGMSWRDTFTDWFARATSSWLGKKSDLMCPMGPFLTTPDEVGNPYDLLVYARQSGWLRDRAHTGAMIIGIERTISWLSSFMTLYPGDVVHMATMGVDGLEISDDMSFGPDDYVEGEIERVGALRVPLVILARGDWRPADDPGRRVHPVPAVRDLIESKADSIAKLEEWTPHDARHFWIVFENYRDMAGGEGLGIGLPPRVLNCPARALAASGMAIHIPRRARTLSLGVELGFVIRQLAHRISEEDAGDYVLGYVAMAVVHDSSFAERVRLPATPQELNLPTIYARWPDGFNVVSPSVIRLEPAAVRGRAMHLSLDGVGEVQGNTDEYVLLAPKVLAFLTRHITLFPGDVVTLGRARNLLAIPVEERLPEGTALHASIEGIGELQSLLEDGRRLPGEP